MLVECLLIGDSIAKGLHRFRPECALFAKVGITSQQFLRSYKDPTPANNIIISLGSNDHARIETEERLRQLRQKFKVGTTAYWILPAGVNPKSGISVEHVQNAVRRVASEHQDVVLPIPVLSVDNVHPTEAGFKALAKQTKGEK